MNSEQAKAFNAGIEAAAKIAQPYQKHSGKPGLWWLRRKKIADDILACKVESEGA